MTINWAILGAGDVAEVKSGPAFQKAPGSALRTVMRRDGDKAEDFAKRHGVPRWTTSVDDVLSDARIDAVYVATPPAAHKELAIAALRAGKHVYLEKPMAMNAAEAVAIAAEAEASDAELVVAHYRRHVPPFMKVGELLASGAIGKVRLAETDLRQPKNTSLVAKTETDWRLNPAVSGGGLFHDLAPHQLDLLLHWFGAPIDAHGVFAPHGNTGPPCPDRVLGVARFAGGVVFRGLWDFDSATPDARDRTTIVGDRGRVEFDFFGSGVTLHREGDAPQAFSFDPLPHVQQPMIEAAMACFRGVGPNPCPAADGVLVTRMIDRMAAPNA